MKLNPYATVCWDKCFRNRSLPPKKKRDKDQWSAILLILKMEKTIKDLIWSSFAQLWHIHEVQCCRRNIIFSSLDNAQINVTSLRISTHIVNKKYISYGEYHILMRMFCRSFFVRNIFFLELPRNVLRRVVEKDQLHLQRPPVGFF